MAVKSMKQSTILQSVAQKGSVLQVVSTTKTDTFSASVASGSFTPNITGLEAAITPVSTSSKIRVEVSISGARSGNYAILVPRIMRDSTAVGVGASAGSRTSASSSTIVISANGNNMAAAGIDFLDSPSTTSEITYGVQLCGVANGSETVYVNRSATDSDSVVYMRVASTITLTEVAG